MCLISEMCLISDMAATIWLVFLELRMNQTVDVISSSKSRSDLGTLVKQLGIPGSISQ